jgi:hypothetical protein
MCFAPPTHSGYPVNQPFYKQSLFGNPPPPSTPTTH